MLAVAVAGFYFGTRAVEAGSEVAESAAQTAGATAAASQQPSVRIVTPTASPVVLDKAADAKLTIGVATDPDNAPVSWTVTGDDPSSVVQL